MNTIDKNFLNILKDINNNNIDEFLQNYSNFKFKSSNWNELNEILLQLNNLLLNIKGNYKLNLLKKTLICKFLIDIYQQQNKYKELTESIESFFDLIELENDSIKKNKLAYKYFMYYKLEFVIKNYDTILSLYETYEKKKRNNKIVDKNIFLIRYINNYNLILSKIGELNIEEIK